MEEELYDITKHGSASYRKLQELNKFEEDRKKDIEEQYELLRETNPDLANTMSMDQFGDYYDKFNQYQTNQNLEQISNLSPGELESLGWESGDISEYFNSNKTSKFDDRTTDYTQYLNIEDVRGQQQSYVGQLASGLGKMALIAGTTFADTFVGTAAGIGNIIYQSLNGGIEKGHAVSGILNAGIQNPVSKKLMEINEKAEDWMPNYYTDKERNAPWYQQFFHANFLGDHFLKNTGFLLGALLAGKATAGILSKTTKLGEARNIFKNTAMAVGLEDKSAKEVLNAYKMGTKIGSEQKVSQALAQAAKNAKKAENEIKIISSAAGSFGESRMEAITNSNDWFERTKNTLDQKKSEALISLDEQIMEEHPEFFAEQPIVDEFGRQVGSRPVLVDEQGYNSEYNTKREEIENKYNDALKQASKYRVDYSNASFLINFALTFGENMQLLGDAFVGSYSKRNVFNSRLRKAAQKSAQKTNNGIGLFGRNAKKAAKEMSQAAKRKIWESNPLQYARDIAKPFASPVFEGTQEMLQQATTTALNRRAGSKINDYYGEVIDNDGLEVGKTWIGNFLNATEDTYADPEQWENFAMGFFTAMLPIPGATIMSSTNQSEKDVESGASKPKRKITANGEFWEGLRQARKNRRESDALADALNDLEQDDKKRNMLFDIIRFDRSNQKQQEALDKGDQKTYKDEESKKLASLVMTYSDAGQIDYLYDLIDEIYTIETPEQIESLKRNTIYSDKGETDTKKNVSIFDEMSDSEIVEYFKEQKEKTLEKAHEYHELYNSINDLYGDFGMGENADMYRKQLAFDIIRIDDREKRIVDLSGKLLDHIKDYADKIKKTMSYKEFPEFDEAIEQLSNIHNLDIAFGEDGVLRKLENEQQKYLSDWNEKYTKLIEEEADLQDLLDAGEEAYEQLDLTEDQINNRIKEITRKIRYVKGRHKMIANSRNSLDMEKDLIDLEKLLSEREVLYTTLASLSGESGKDLFKNMLSIEIFKQFADYDRNGAKNVYEEYKKSGILQQFGHDLDEVISVAQENNDDLIANELGLVKDYNEAFYSGVIDMDDDDNKEIYNDVISIIQESRGQDEEKIRESVKKYLEDDSGDPNINSLKGLVLQHVNLQQQRKNDIENTKESVEYEKTEAKTESERILDSFFTKSDNDFQTFLNQFNDTNEFIEVLEHKGWLDTIKAMFKEEQDVDIEDYEDSFEDLKNALIDIRSKGDYNSQQTEGGNNEDEDEGEDEDEEAEEDSGTGNTGGTVARRTKKQNKGIRQVGDEIAGGTVDEIKVDPFGDSERDDNQPDDEYEQPAETIDDLKGSLEQESIKPVKQRTRGRRGRRILNVSNKADGSGNSQDFAEDLSDTRITDAWDVMRYGGSYDVGKLRSNELGQYEFTDNDLANEGQNIPTIYKGMVEKLKSQEFIQSGLLSKVVDYFGKKDKSRASIRFVTITDDNMIGGGYKARSFVQKRIPLAAIELSKEDIDQILADEQSKVKTNDDRDRFEILKKQFADNTNILEFRGRKGQKTRYFQVLGPVTPQFFGGKSTYVDGKIEGTAYKKLFRDNDFERFMASFASNIEQTRESGNKDINGGVNNEAYYRYSDFVAPIEYIYTGRLIKKTDAKQDAEQKVYLKDILSKDQIENPNGHLQVRVRLKNGVRDFGANLGGKVVDLNTNFEESLPRQYGQTRNGTVWILTKEADGKVYHKGTYVNMFTQDWYNDNKNDPNNAYIQGIRNVIAGIAKTDNIDEVRNQLYRLHGFIYQDEAHELFYNPKTKMLYVGKDRNNGQSLAGSDMNKITEDAIQFMLKMNPDGYRFSLSSDNVTLKQIVDSNILSTNLAILHNVGASFAISKLAVNEETGMFEPKPSAVLANVKATKLHTGVLGMDPLRQDFKMSINGKTLRVYQSDGKLNMSIDGKRIPRSQYQYYKNMLDAYENAYFGNTEPYFAFRGSGLYVYKFYSGINDQRPLGLVLSRKSGHKHFVISADDIELLQRYMTARRKHEKLNSNDIKKMNKLFDNVGALRYAWMDEKAQVKDGKKRSDNGNSEKQDEDPLLEQPKKTDIEKFIEDRYGKDYPKIGNVIRYYTIKTDPNGAKDKSGFADEHMEEATIVGYSSKYGLKLSNGNYISQNSIDLFYGLTKSKDPKAVSYKHIAQITAKNNVVMNSAFGIDDEFEIVKPEVNTEEKKEDKKVDDDSRKKKDKNNGGKGGKDEEKVNFTKGSGKDFKDKKHEPGNTIKDASGVFVNPNQLKLQIGKITKYKDISYLNQLNKVKAKGDSYGIPGRNIIEMILNIDSADAVKPKQELKKLLEQGVNDGNIQQIIDSVDNIIECRVGNKK